MKKTTVLLVDEHKFAREGLRSVLEKEQDIEVVGEADNGRVAVRLAKELKPAVVLVDVVMPEMNGVEATRQILAAVPGIKVLAVSFHRDRMYVVDMLKAGVSGYLLKDSVQEELCRAVRVVAKNETFLSSAIAGVVVGDYRVKEAGQQPDRLSNLRPRAREVLQLIAEGRTTKEIAAALHLSVKTVGAHRQQIMNRLDVHSVAELTKVAVRLGLTPLE